ncbi:DUF1501 domain-containing protein [Bordetella genomosp. 13]|uniref:Tat pathway signal protein n=1 Tax=Bordetella genomosp. 13 TaxID=463040 RepID=A0A1W6ZAF4_9BORD|nr:DUF1501 domain-containing protein [Bordetella genomosp. 13]ARP94232.1 hypothetical protein CAL15_07470 [Bordetella genomosp. 13]
MDRRRFLTHAASLPLLFHGARLYAAPAADARLLVVFMRGAYDCASLLVPTDSDFYYESRPNIAIARPGTAPDAAVALVDGWALHPAVAENLLPLYRQGELAFVPFAGTDNLSRSHFETQNSIELGRAGAARGKSRTGFLNRLSALLSEDTRRPAAFTRDVPQILRGDLGVPNIDLGGGSRKSSLTDERARVLADMYRGTDLAAPVDEGLMVAGQVSEAMLKEMAEANGKAGSAQALEQQARRIGSFMADRYNIGFVDVGGWDTHVSQGSSTGALASNLGRLGRALAAYADAMGRAWRNTTVVVISEFGRTFRENGNKGTDHGHGTVYWVLGGNVNGGRIAGRQVKVEQATLFQDRDFPVLTDYRDLFAGLFGRLYGLGPAQLERVFPGVRPRDLQLV